MKQGLRIVVVTIVASVVLGIVGFHLGRWSMQKTWLDERARLEEKLREMAQELNGLNDQIRTKRMADRKKREEIKRRIKEQRKKRAQSKPASGPSTKPGAPTKAKPGVPSPAKTKPAPKRPTPTKGTPKPASKPATAPKR